MLRDHDSKFVLEFDAVLEADGVTVVPVSIRAPNMNAVAERWVQSITIRHGSDVMVLKQPYATADRLIMLLQDPDGRKVEVSQRLHG